jgi:hypothetical protein
MKELNKSQGDWNEDAKIDQNPLFQTTFVGFLRFLEEEK